MTTLEFSPLQPLAAKAVGVDLSQPLTASVVAAIEFAMDHYGVLVFQNQALTQDQQIAFARQLGPLDIGFGKVKGPGHRLKYRELGDISNLSLQGEVAARDSQKIVGNIANQLWHSDSSFQRPRAKYSMLYAVEVPAVGGDTEFADLRLAYDALPDWQKKQIDGLVARHHPLHSRLLLGDTNYSQAQRDAITPSEWPLVQTDPRSGRKILYVGSHACEVIGLTLPEGRLLIMDLLEYATQRQFVYRHTWAANDLVMWDNTATVHRGRYFDVSQRRDLRRATTEEVAA